MFTCNEPAANIHSVVKYLRDRHAADLYLYRGQTREYPGPLLPSLYRPYSTGLRYQESDLESNHSLRRSGHLFVALDPDKGWFGPAMDKASKIGDERLLMDALYTLQVDQNNDVIVASGALRNFLVEHFPDQDARMIDLLTDHLTEVTNSHHRRYIRDVVLPGLLGQLLGGIIAQQYGFFSGYIDVTTSLDVVAFFATHSGPEYKPTTQIVNPGILYCFPKDSVSQQYTKQQAMLMRPSSYPSYVVFEDIVKPFCSNNPDYVSSIKKYVEYAIMVLLDGGPGPEDLKLPLRSLQYSRLGRQCAAVLIPDRIVEPHYETPEPVYYDRHGWHPARRFAVEDLASRPGVEKYYFKHSDEDAEEGMLTREYLWPRNSDFFCMVVYSLLMLGIDLGGAFPATGYFQTHVPRRSDLVDAGYINTSGSLERKGGQ